MDMMHIGKEIRALRKDKKITMVELAKLTDFSQSYLSQIERGKVNPSVSALQKISHAFGIPMAYFFENKIKPENNESTATVVKIDQRKGLVYPSSGVQYQLLTPNLKGNLEVLYITAEPGGETGRDKFMHDGEECGFVVQGIMEITVGNSTHRLNPGDAITFSSSEPHSWKNVSEEKLIAYWSVTPPSF